MNRIGVFASHHIKLLIVSITCISVFFLPHNLAELVSLCLTFPTVILGIGVVVVWGRPALTAFKKPATERDAVDWLILGVAVGFLGASIDNTYWGFAWTADYLQHPYRDWLFAHGVYANIPSRQVAGSYAAWCHLNSHYRHSKNTIRDMGRLHQYNQLSWAMGVCYVLLLLSLKGN